MNKIANKNLYNIPSTEPFFQSFVRHFFSLYEKANFQNQDPLALSKVVIYVPTKRAARALRESFALEMGQESCILPRIFALHDTKALEEGLNYSGQLAFLPPIIAEFDRLIVLATLIQSWHAKLPEKSRALFGTEAIAIPNTACEAFYLAQQLAKLMDDVTKYDADPKALDNLMDQQDLAEWWQISQEFLQILFQYWPEFLKERHVITDTEAYKYLYQLQIKHWQSSPPQTMVIALGLKDPPPFIKAIMDLPKGLVYFQGVDFDLDEESWQTLSVDEKLEPAVASHPQYAFYHLLNFLKIARCDIKNLGQKSERAESKIALISTLLCPASMTHKWVKASQHNFKKALHAIALIEAENEYEEALSVAIFMRECLEKQKKTVALVTNDRTFARRVALDLRRFGVIANESLGQPLRQSFGIVFIKLLLDCLIKPYDPITFLALLKHPFMKVSQNRRELRHLIEFFEYRFLRTEKPASLCYADIHLWDFQLYFESCLDYHSQEFKERFDREIKALLNFAQSLEQATLAFKRLEKDKLYSLKNLVQLTIQTVEACTSDENGDCSALYSGASGDSLAEFFRALLMIKEPFSLSLSEWPFVFDSLLQDRNLTPRPYGHPRVFIWGLLEAQLQETDYVILSNMNEGQMPNYGMADPFLSRQMKQAMALKSPEYHLGLEAHVFQTLISKNAILMTRSLHVNGSPSVPSRWLQRLEAVIGTASYQELTIKGHKYQRLAKFLDKGKNTPFATPPYPCPPLEIRPKVFSVTEIDLLRRNPYAIYAKKILKLKPLVDLLPDKTARMRGQLYHEILEAFTQVIADKAPEQYEILFQNIMQKKFDEACLPPDIYGLWWQILKTCQKDYIAFEQQRINYRKYSEKPSKKILVGDSGVALHGRADRIDLQENRTACSVEILDLKTGNTPTKADAYALKNPQLALEAALCLEGGFFDDLTVSIDKLIYLRFVHNGFKVEDILEREKQDKDAQKGDLIKNVWQKLEKLFMYYNKVEHGYSVHALPPKEFYVGTKNWQKQYDHLARIFEWSQSDFSEDTV